MLHLLPHLSNGQVFLYSSDQNSLGKNYDLAFDAVFGSNGWTKFDSKGNVDSLIKTNPSFIYLEGKTFNSSRLETFFAENLSQLEDWVSKGGVLYLNIVQTYPSYKLGFGDIITQSYYYSDSAYVVDPQHPLFNGSYKPVSNKYIRYNSSNRLGYTQFEGEGLIPLLINKADSTGILMAEKKWRHGRVIFSALNDFKYLLPYNEAQNLQKNILSLKADKPDFGAVYAFESSESMPCIGNVPIKLSILNYGSLPSKSITINWQVDGQLQNPVTFAGGVPGFDGENFHSGSVLLGNVPVEFGKTKHLKAWVLEEGETEVDTMFKSLSRGLNGNYLVGAGGDFATIGEAVETLNNTGVCAPVVFNIQSGNYEESVKINKIKGASAINTVTFQSASKDSSKVILSTSKDFVFHLDTVSYLTIQHLTLKNTSTYGNVLKVQKGSHHIAIKNNHITGVETNSSAISNSAVLVESSSNTVSENIVIENNLIEKGSFCLYLSNYSFPSSVDYESGIRIINNKLVSSYYCGVYISNFAHSFIKNNRIISGVDYFIGIRISNGKGRLDVSNNEIELKNYGYGLYLSYISSDSTQPAELYNNTVISKNEVNSSSTSYGIYLTNLANFKISHNTVNIISRNSNSKAFYGYDVSNLALVNNIFSIRGLGNAFYVSKTYNNSLKYSDYNNFYSSVDQPIYYGIEYFTLKRWQDSSNYDKHSLDINPKILENGFTPGSYALDNKGKVTPEYSRDYEGKVRSNTTPDMGAVEFEASGSDLNLDALNDLKPGLNDLAVYVKNEGQTAVSSFSVNYALNDTVYGPFNWEGLLVPGGSVELSLGKILLKSGVGYNLKVYLKDHSDIYPLNDTIVLQNLLFGIAAGEYTVGGQDPDYKNFSEVEQALKLGGITGTVRFLVRDGVYEEGLVLDNIKGAGGDNYIIFESESGDSSKVILRDTVLNYSYLVSVRNTENVIFKGLTIEALGNGYGIYAVSFSNRFGGSKLQNNRIIKVGSNGVAVTFSGTGKGEHAIIVENNSIESENALNIEINDPESLSIVRNNHFTGTAIFGGTFDLELAGNNFNNKDKTASKSAIRFDYYRGSAAVVKNIVRGFKGYGINFSHSYGKDSETPILIANNYINISGTPLYVYNSTTSVYYNTFVCSSTSPAISLQTLSGIKIINNNIVNTQGGRALYLSSNLTTATLDFDYNNYFTSGTSLIYCSSCTGNTSPTLSQWSFFSNTDRNSLNLDPKFLSDSTFEFSNYSLVGNAIAIPSVTDDITGKPRNNPSNAGAWEIAPTDFDASIVGILPIVKEGGEGNGSVQVVIKNLGTTALADLKIQWSVNDAIQTPFVWSGNLPSFETDTLTIGGIEAEICTNYKLAVWLESSPSDMNRDNDSVSVAELKSPLIGTYTIGKSASDFSSFTQAITCLSQNGVQGKVIFQVKPGEYLERIVIEKIEGASAENTITFRAENGDSTGVMLTYSATSSLNYIVRLNNTRHLIFEKITFKPRSSNYAGLVQIDGESKHITFRNVVFSGFAGNGSNQVVLNNKVESIHFYNNEFLYGGRGIYANQNINIYNNTIVGNRFINQVYNGILAYYQGNFTIHSNTMSSTYGVANSYEGIYLSRCLDSVSIKNNKFDLENGGVGIYILAQQYDDSSKYFIANNAIVMSGNGKSRGVYIDSYENTKIYCIHNTVRIGKGNSENNGFALKNSSNCHLYNNLIVNEGHGAALFVEDNFNLTSDYNNYFSANGNAFVIQGNSYSLEELIAQFETDSHSISKPVVFNAVNDYRTNDLAIQDKGVFNALADTDIDGEPRTSTPDLGADELKTLTNDLALQYFLNPIAPVVQGINKVQAVVFNKSNGPVNQINIQWSVNDVLREPFLWTGVLASEDTLLINLGDVDFQPGSVVNLKAWLNNPLDPFAGNDTIISAPLMCAMQGVYTIGTAANADFNSFTKAAEVLNLAGVSGPVLFNVASGTYSEQVLINEIVGASETNSITFKGADNAKSILAYSVTTKNPLFHLRGTRHITVENMHFEPTRTGGSILKLENGASYNTFKNNYIKSSTTDTLINIAGSIANQFNKIDSNYFINGKIGILLTHASIGNRIIGNQFRNQSLFAISAVYQKDIVVNSNSISTRTSDINYAAIALNWSSGILNVEGNNVIIHNGKYGITITNSDLKVDQPGIVANNFVSIKGSNTYAGLDISYSDFYKVYFNTIQNHSTRTSSYAFYTTSSDSLNAKNNIFATTGSGYVTFMPAYLLKDSDYNNFYSVKGNITSNIVGLRDWQIQSDHDWHSLSVDPQFKSDTTFKFWNTQLDKIGIGIPEIAVDIEGDPRDPLTPSIGADESVPAQIDAGMQAVTSPEMPFKLGSQKVTAVLRNFGTNTLSSVNIGWSVNGIRQDMVTWNGSLKLGETETIELGNYEFQSTETYIIKSWTDKPNNSEDGLFENDTATGKSLLTALSGVYTIGGSNPDYAKISLAVADMEKRGIVDSVIFLVRNGHYNDQISIPQILGADKKNSVTFQSESGRSADVTIEYRGTYAENYVVQLDSTRGISFKNLTFSSSDAYYSTLIRLVNGSKDVLFDGNIFKGQSISYMSESYALVNSVNGGDQTNNLTFINNTFINGSNGLNLSGISRNVPDIGLIVSNNSFVNQGAAAIYYQSQEFALFSNNKIYSNTSNTSFKGIYSQNSVRRIYIERNQITVENSGFGIYLEETELSGEATLISNNLIRVSGNNTATGLYVTTGYRTKIYHNNVYVSSNNLSTSNSAIYLSGKQMEVLNNIFATNGFAYLTNFRSLPAICDYNNYYATDNYKFYYTSSIYDSLSAWKKGLSKDQNSFSIDPVFYNDTNLRVVNAYLYHTVPALDLVAIDIDSVERENPTTVGAHTTDASKPDAALTGLNNPVIPYVAGIQDVEVILQNNYLDTLRSVSIHWSINGEEQPVKLWSGKLAIGKDDAAVIGAFDFEAGKEFVLKAWVSNPNGEQDNLAINDTISTDKISSGLRGVYTIGGLDADYPNFTKASEALNNWGVVGEVVFKATKGVYSEQIVIDSISGASAENTITFESMDADSSSVTITYANTSNKDYVVHLNGADHVRFKNLFLKSTGSSPYGNVIKLSNGADHNFITNCILQGIYSYAYTTEDGLINSSGTDKYITIENNRFVEGSYGVRIARKDALYTTNSIRNNEFINQKSGAINISNQDSTIVENNIITSLSNATSYNSITLTLGKNCRIFGNRISGATGISNGIYLNSTGASAVMPNLIYNNFINLNSGNGINCYYHNYSHIYHNTVRIGNGTTNHAFRAYSSNDIIVKNNIFAHLGANYSVAIEGSKIESDYNDLYAAAGVIGTYAYTTYSTLAEWVVATGLDSNSVSVDPVFYSENDLHVSQSNLDGRATPIDYIQVDIDGHIRNSENPDIGADEFGSGLQTRDIGVVKLLNPSSSCDLTGQKLLEIRIQNYGVDTIQSFPVSYRLNDTLIVKEIVTNMTLRGGQSMNYTFQTPVDFSREGVYKFDFFTSLENDTVFSNDTLANQLIQHYAAVKVEASRDTTICEEATLMLEARGASSYSWYYSTNMNYLVQHGSVISIKPTIERTMIVIGKSSDGCTDQDTVQVSVIKAPETPVITSAGNNTDCYQGGATLTSDKSHFIRWSTGETSPSIDIFNSGTYSVTYTDTATGCTSTASRHITVNSRPMPFITANSVCPGTQVSMGIKNGGQNFLWSTGATTSQITVSPESSQIYSVSYGTSGSCRFTESFTVNVIVDQSEFPVINKIVADSTICLGEEVQIRVEGKAGKFTWSNNRIGSTIYVSPTSKTKYVVTASSGICSSLIVKDSIEIDVLPVPDKSPIIVASGSRSLTLCETKSLLLLSSDYAENIIWSTGDTTQSIVVTQEGTYKVMHKNQYGCFKESSVIIKDPPTPYISGNTEVCEGASTQLSVIYGSKYIWSTGDTTATIQVSPNTTTKYTVNVKNDEGCEHELSTTVKITPSPRITDVSPNTTVCKGDRLVLNVSGDAKQFIWSNGQTGNRITVYPDSNTVYSVIARNGCSGEIEDQAEIEVITNPTPAKPVINYPDLVYMCDGNELDLVTNVPDGIIDVKWSTGFHSPSITVTSEGKYSVTHINTYNCSSLSSVNVQYPNAPYIRGNLSICEGDSSKLSVIGGDAWKWSTGEEMSSIMVSPDTTTTYKVLVQSGEGCEHELSAEIIIFNTPTITSISADTSICMGQSMTLKVSGNAKEFIWSNNQKGSSITVSPATSGEFTVRASNTCLKEVEVSEKVMVTVNPVPEIPKISSSQLTLCQGETAVISTNLTNNLVWSTGDTSSSIRVSKGGDYSVTVKNEFNCSATGTIKIQNTMKPELTVKSGYSSICKGDTAHLAMQNAQTFLWSTNESSSEIRVNPETSSFYSVKGFDLNGCTYEDTITIQVLAHDFPEPVSNMIPTETSSNLNLPLNLSWTPSFNAGKYDIHIWEVNSNKPATPLFSNVQEIQYRVQKDQLEFGKEYNWQVTAKNSCESTEGPVQQFVLRKLPDLVAKNILAPTSAFSGQEVKVSWEIENTGLGATQANENWFDGVYLSSDSIFDSDVAQYMTGVSNTTALNSGGTYSSEATFTLPKGIAGTYYFFINANNHYTLVEASQKNNVAGSSRYTLIKLTPAPDLQVTEIQKPNNVFSGQKISVTWKVANKGKGLVNGSWVDKIYFSKDSVLRTSRAVELKSVAHSQILNPDEFYVKSDSVTLPLEAFGTYYIHVLTDATDKIYEYAYNNNNSLSSTRIEVILLPPSDLVVTDFTMPFQASNNEKITLSYKVSNKGGSETNVSRWRDYVYLSKEMFLDEHEALLLHSTAITGSLPIEASYSKTFEVTIPDNITGPYFIFVNIDKDNQVFEFENESNNKYRSIFQLMVNSPDLIVENALINTSTPKSGDTVSLSWSIKNEGPGTGKPTTWTDSIFVSKFDDYDLSRAYFVGVKSVKSSLVLEVNDTIKVSGTIKLPEGIYGDYYLYIQTNANKALYEDVANTTNIFRTPISIQLSPSADLVVSSVHSDSVSVTAGDSLPIKFTVQNQGEAPTKTSSWIEGIYLSRSNEPGKDKIYIGSTKAKSILEVGNEAEYEVKFVVPEALNAGNYYIHIITDTSDIVYEHAGEANNINVYGPLAVKAKPSQNLEVTRVTAHDTLYTFTDFVLEWEVRNSGQIHTSHNEWSDVVFLSKDTLVDEKLDIKLGVFGNRNGLDPDSAYTNLQSVSIPDGKTGDYYIIVIASYKKGSDALYNTPGNILSNNKYCLPVKVMQSPVADLVVTSRQMPTDLLAGQPVMIKYTVTNKGVSTTRPNSWVDRIYLSKDLKVADDIVLATINRKDSLAPGQSYTDSVEVKIPLNVSGNYVILIGADATDRQFELNNENNIGFVAVNIVVPLPADLVVAQVSSSQTEFLAGEPIEVKWKISNIGINPVIGYAEDQVYLSKDSTWDHKDILLLSQRTYFNLAPNASKEIVKSDILENVTNGKYYLIVKTDVKNNILETNENNNSRGSDQGVSIDVKELFLNIQEETVMRNRLPLYYKIDIHDSLVGETLLITLDGDELQAVNELFIKYDGPADRNSYDDGFDNPFFGDQEVLIPQLRAGTYYIMAYGYHKQNTTQNISLLASILPFEIRSVKTDRGGNTGSATTCIEGAKFTTETKFTLVSDDTTIVASKIYFTNSTKVFATFDLQGMPVGWYDVVAEDSLYDVYAVKLGAFRVEKGTGYKLETDLEHVAVTRRGRIEPIHIHYANGGNIDIPNPINTIISRSGVPVALDVAGLKYDLRSLKVKMIEVEGPDDILRPGASGTITIYVKATNDILVKFLK